MLQDLNIEEVKALYFNENALREPAYRLSRIDGNDIRYYYDIDELGQITYYPSWTSVINKIEPTPLDLIKWMCELGWEKSVEQRDLRAEYGTCMHILIAHFLLKKEFNTDSSNIWNILIESNIKLSYFKSFWINDLAKDLTSFVQFANDVELEPFAIEIPLISRAFGVAGTIDLVCRMNWQGKRTMAIVDFKSGKKGVFESSEMQLKAYELMWNENFQDTKIEQLFNWNPKEFRTKNATYTLTNQTDKHLEREIQIDVEKFKLRFPIKPSPKLQITGTLKLGRDINYINIVGIDEIIKNKQKIPAPTPTFINSDGEIESEMDIDFFSTLGKSLKPEHVVSNNFLEF